MKTIVQIVQHLHTGGIEVMALELARLVDQDTQVYLVSLEGTKDDLLANWPRLVPYAARLFALEKPPGISLGTVRKLARLLEKLGVDAVHTHHIGPLLYGGLAAKIAKIPRHVHTEHDAWHLDDKRRRRLEYCALTILRPQLVADSAAVAHALKRHMPAIDTKVVLNGVDTELFLPGDKLRARARLGLPVEGELIGCAGRLAPEKGHRFLIEAMQYLPRSTYLALAGEGPLRQDLARCAQQLGVQGRVFFCGSQRDMPLFYQALDIFCQPSLNEGMPLAPLEAQACNVPVVMTRVGAYAEVLCPYSSQSALPGCPVSLAAALRSIIRTSHPREPRKFVLQHANARAMSERYAQLCVG